VSDAGYRLIVTVRERGEELGWRRETIIEGKNGTDERGKSAGLWKMLRGWKCLIERDRHYHKLQNSEGMSHPASVCICASVFKGVYSRCLLLCVFTVCE